MRKYAIAAITLLACSGFAQVKTWTTTADFDEGIYFNTNSSFSSGALRLNQFGTAPVPFINIPVAGRQLTTQGWNYSPGRIVRVNTETGKVEGEYLLAPVQHETSPSRAVVDGQGNVWVTTRYEGSGVYAVTKVGVLIGGTRHYRPLPGVYVPHPLGEYVKDPDYTTGVDRDGDGYIRTSAGAGNYLNWNGTAGKDLDGSLPESAPGTVQEADDELILVFKRFNSSNGTGRCVAIDENDNVWVGANVENIAMWRLNGVTGVVELKRPSAAVTILTRPSIRTAIYG